jgi:hypothetical protein
MEDGEVLHAQRLTAAGPVPGQWPSIAVVPVVVRAEVDHAAVDRTLASVLEVLVFRRSKLRHGECGKHELVGDAHQIQQLAALGSVHRAEAHPTLLHAMAGVGLEQCLGLGLLAR